MTITIGPEHEQLIADAIESGAYAGPDEVIARAIEALRDDDLWLAANKAEISNRIARGIMQLDRGEGISGDQLSLNLEERKARWRASQRAS